jgi:hypothetical protein
MMMLSGSRNWLILVDQRCCTFKTDRAHKYQQYKEKNDNKILQKDKNNQRGDNSGGSLTWWINEETTVHIGV